MHLAAVHLSRGYFQRAIFRKSTHSYTICSRLSAMSRHRQDIGHAGDVEVVEDSEPEREQFRRQQTSEQVDHKNSKETKGKKARALVKPAVVIDITDESSGVDIRTNVLTIVGKTSNKARYHDDTRDGIRPRLKNIPSDTYHSTDDDEDESSSNLNIARFVYRQATPLVNSKLPRPQQTLPRASEKEPKEKDPVRRSSNPFSREFTEMDVKHLNKCMACDLRWTTRKTGSQKLIHIRTCANKKGLTVETARILLVKETASTLEDKQKATISDGDSTMPKTLFEDCAGDIIAPKRKHGPLPTATILAAVDTRQRILRRARAVLGPSETPSEGHISNSSLILSQALETIEVSINGECWPRTQTLARTTLFQNNLSAPGESELDEVCEESSWTFAPSKLGGALIGQHVLDEVYSIDESSSKHNDSSYSLVTHSAKDPNTLMETKNNTVTPLQDARMFDLVNGTPLAHTSLDKLDDAYLHYDPETDNTLWSRSHVVPGLAIHHPKKKIPKAASPTKDPVVGKKSARKDKRNDGQTQSEWEETMKHKITTDTNLYLRILRFEPVNFDIFLKLDGGDITGKAKERLRTFLDSQAINHFGATEPRTRRHRR
ncbi:hypothetical protein BDQ12DRAFT_674925 [Crucibulum laeve]|uniref:Uncharacterized protein n=1 Tax=Crucibulum laeve TaxID=68775 RepID=A0A5C3MFI1_9AGAR|nr:hypothetical protein BDQ12DRAFT_674925 [Crucibulum laeve]